MTIREAKPKALDLFCGAGAVSVGLQRAGFEVTAVDIMPQPRHAGGSFIQGNAMTFSLRGFDFIWASPPCQAYTVLRSRWPGREHPDLVNAVRERLVSLWCPWVIENVPNAPLRQDLLLCGSMFGLDVRRHRIFEATFPVVDKMECRHDLQLPRFRSLDRRLNGRLSSVVTVHGHSNYKGEKQIREKAMGIDWMNVQELSQAVPPAYAEYIGRQAMALIS